MLKKLHENTNWWGDFPEYYLMITTYRCNVLNFLHNIQIQNHTSLMEMLVELMELSKVQHVAACWPGLLLHKGNWFPHDIEEVI